MKKKNVVKAVVVASLAGLFAVGSSVPASAAGTASTSVGSRTSVSLTTDYPRISPVLPERNTLSVTVALSGHTANTVYASSVRICSGILPGGGAIELSPAIGNQNGQIVQYQYKTVPSTGCQTWAINRTFTKGSTGELFRVTSHVNRTYTTISGFNR
ncbi:hypothetical protein ITJ55_10555 [Frigoribacterium sp. VKM Ac-1396]|uniref:hypothetical protein n=1 Tax=Frigoribacterium sp. VKM Ac-1396 TaxID=2783821 RepID=UPI00188BF25A|nr:hypothetical protein [Frigoribacterium sp. VKM Ac-1396]MBF4601250.1 hypothetical protein [Frigoribacterium sp. VKM Ac-1396]